MTPNLHLRALQATLSEGDDRERFIGLSRALARVQEQRVPGMAHRPTQGGRYLPWNPPSSDGRGTPTRQGLIQ